ncbi:unnamed protein product, partial [Mesorhabditis spiculigera]
MQPVGGTIEIWARLLNSRPSQLEVVEVQPGSDEGDQTATVGEDSPGAPSSAGSANLDVPDEEDDVDEPNSSPWQEGGVVLPQNFMELFSKNFLEANLKAAEMARDSRDSRAESVGNLSPMGMDGMSSPRRSPQLPVLPGAQVVAQLPHSQIFRPDDWSWHRNPAAAIRSGGTNKQTPVWKYFVYNKAENLSRCIVGNCTYHLKGPHTSTLACHLKKHPEEYREFQKLKAEYSRERCSGQLPPSPSSSASSATSSGGSAGNGAVKSKPKSKPQAPKNLSSIAEALSKQAAAALQASAATLGPQGLMNSLGLLHPLPNPGFSPFLMNPAAIPTSTAFPQPFFQQQTALNLATQNVAPQFNSKKWRKDEQKQKELESRLALMIAANHLHPEIIKDACFQQFLELAQPKFNLPEEPSNVESSIAAEYVRMTENIKNQLASARRITLVAETVPISREGEQEAILLVVSAVYLSPTNNLDYALLGIRHLENPDSKAIHWQVENLALERYNCPLKRVSRILLPDVGEESSLQENTIEPHFANVLNKLAEAIQTSTHLEDLRSAIHNLLVFVGHRPQFIQRVKGAGGKLPMFSPSEPFQTIIGKLSKLKNEISQAMEKEEDQMANLSEEHWSQIEELVALSDELVQRLSIRSGKIQTIDTVVPSLLQLRPFLELQSCPKLAEEIAELFDGLTGPILDSTHPHFDGSFLQATALNLQLARCLNEEQLDTAKESLIQTLQAKLSNEEPRRQKTPMNVDDLLAICERKQSGDAESSPALTPFSIANIGSPYDFLQALPKSNELKQRAMEVLVGHYWNEILPGEGAMTMFGMMEKFAGSHLPPLAYWSSKVSHAGLLAEYAITLLSTPALPLSPDRIFSQTGLQSPLPGINFSPINLPLQHARFERDVLLRFNKTTPNLQ